MVTKNILVIGGNGQIGRELINYKTKKLKFFVFDIRKLKNNNKQIKFLHGSCHVKKDIKNLPASIDIVIFLAGKKGGPQSLNLKYYKDYFKSNCDTLINFLNYNKIKKLKKIIFISTEQVYNDYFVYNSKKLLTEPRPKNYYGSSKLFSEKFLYNYWLSNKIGIDVIRTPRIIDNKKKNLIYEVIKGYKSKKIIINSNNSFNFIYVEDFISALFKSIMQNNNKYRILNVFNSSKPITIMGIANILKKTFKFNTKIIFKVKKNFLDHNPSNLRISNESTRKQLKWKPLFSTEKIVKILTK